MEYMEELVKEGHVFMKGKCGGGDTWELLFTNLPDAHKKKKHKAAENANDFAMLLFENGPFRVNNKEWMVHLYVRGRSM
ncbi:unnamed protein product [Brassica oleracea var. botrytis]|uniref:Uncharacterized protein n=2 Tax=Brassica TaxID=3705 RepID=A0A3P6F054_BRAOL|nr:unnamed protein product [Brassica napus]CDY20346.1 BnaC01g23940D [Brassica napus]VDD51003.1 unnamed protein product [Brassica oleracea]